MQHKAQPANAGDADQRVRAARWTGYQLGERIYAETARTGRRPETFPVNPADLEALEASPDTVYRMREDNTARDPVLAGVVLLADEGAERISPAAP